MGYILQWLLPRRKWDLVECLSDLDRLFLECFTLWNLTWLAPRQSSKWSTLNSSKPLWYLAWTLSTSHPVGKRMIFLNLHISASSNHPRDQAYFPIFLSRTLEEAVSNPSRFLDSPWTTIWSASLSIVISSRATPGRSMCATISLSVSQTSAAGRQTTSPRHQICKGEDRRTLVGEHDTGTDVTRKDAWDVCTECSYSSRETGREWPLQISWKDGRDAYIRADIKVGIVKGI